MSKLILQAKIPIIDGEDGCYESGFRDHGL